MIPKKRIVHEAALWYCCRSMVESSRELAFRVHDATVLVYHHSCHFS